MNQAVKIIEKGEFMKKRIQKIILILGIIFLFSILILPRYYNDYIAKTIANEIKEIPLPEKTEFLEKKYVAGKLNGCGNGMQYYGAILIKSELSENELKEYYNMFSDSEWSNIVEKQIGNSIEMIEHRDIFFQTKFEDNVDYFIVYTWGDYSGIASELDIRGH